MSTGTTFGLDVSGTSGRRVVRATGRLVAGAGAEAPEWTATGMLGPVEQVVLELAEVTAIDAGGLGRLLALRQALVRRGARLTIGSASPRVRRVLQLTALDAIFGMAPGDVRGHHGAGFAPAPVVLCRCA